MKINLAKMGKMLVGGKSPQDCMKEFGCSEVAFYKAKKKLDPSVTAKLFIVSKNSIKAKPIKPEILESRKDLEKKYDKEKLTVMQQIGKADKVINQILDELIDKKRTSIQDKNIIIKAASELLKQAAFQLEISKQLYNLLEIKKFQEIVVQIFEKLDPDDKKKFKQRLRDYRSLRGHVDLT